MFDMFLCIGLITCNLKTILSQTLVIFGAINVENE